MRSQALNGMSSICVALAIWPIIAGFAPTEGLMQAHRSEPSDGSNSSSSSSSPSSSNSSNNSSVGALVEGTVRTQQASYSQPGELSPSQANANRPTGELI